VNAVGANCSLGPKQLQPVVEELVKCASIPVVLKPNAGLPIVVNGKTVFNVSPSEFAIQMGVALEKGVRLLGGCCGTTPEYIQELVAKTKDCTPSLVQEKNRTVVSSYTHAVEFGQKAVLIGERINPTGKKRFKQALVEGDVNYILNEGVSQQEKGAQVLDVNVGLPEIDEQKMLVSAVCELQSVVDLPLQIDTSDPVAMELALRRYNGKAMVNSVNGKKESMERVFPLVKKYGGLVVALTLDENGIPETAEGRVEIARKILKVAAEYGIEKKDLIFDPLAMAVSAENGAAIETLKALKMIKEELGANTSLGVSNVSFGLPNRDFVNAAFFTLALENGLSAAIMNPYSGEMLKAYYTFNLLKGQDENCSEYVQKSSLFASTTVQAAAVSSLADNGKTGLYSAVLKGFKEQAAEETKRLLESKKPLEIVNEEIIPALNAVGEGFEKKTLYLPQLLMSAEAAKSAFEEVKKALSSTSEKAVKGPIVLATVSGDIHDIGKNIVKLLLENYGFDVRDLGKDVPVQTVVLETVRLHAPLVGLSALMTTTVPFMEQTIARLRKEAPWCKVMVGGAVLTEEYAAKIGADKYAKDAMESVRYAEQILQ
ncbi:MAG: dihydropteroate synthase, partial [Clostridia bacterium]|nr:dihydropteroate synthase [Clostridia bacterium]